MRRLLFAAVLVLTPFLALWSLPNPAHASFQQNNLIDAAKFDNVNSMSQADIQNFLAHFSTSCLSGYQSPDPSDYSTFGANVPASKVIYDAAQFWGLNPQVILTTLEKEESLVTGGVGCAAWRYTTAMGYDCPDSGSCPAHASNAGFSQQVMHAGWQLRFNEQRSIGNLAWDGDGAITYAGYMTPGRYARVQGGTVVTYDGTATIDGSSVTMTNGPTASLYSYTPHFHGNQNFVSLYEQWFGPTHGNGPAAVLYQATGSSAIYLFDPDQNILWLVPNMNVFAAYGFTTDNVDTVSPTTISSMTKSSTPLSIIFRAESNGTVFITSNGIANGFDSGDMFTAWGLSGSQVSALPDLLVDSIPKGPNLTSLSADSQGLIYWVNGGHKYFISDPATFAAAGFDWANVVGTSTTALALVPDATFNLSLVGDIAVYRLASQSGSYLLTTSTVERNAAVGRFGYRLDGIGFSVPATGTGQTSPVYRLASRATGSYLYTISPAERDFAASHGYALEGAAFNAAATQVAGSTPVYRLVNRASGKYLFTDSNTETSAAGSFNYAVEGVAFYAWP